MFVGFPRLRPAFPPSAATGHRLGSVVLAAGLAAGILTGLAAAPASAGTVCDLDVCVIYPDTVQTPLGPVTVTVSATNVVTVQLAPTVVNILVFGVPYSWPPGPPGLPGLTRTSIETTGGLVTIDTLLPPPSRWALPNLAIVSIHPPNPCRATTSGTTVVFTPISPPGPPN